MTEFEVGKTYGIVPGAWLSAFRDEADRGVYFDDDVTRVTVTGTYSDKDIEVQAANGSLYDDGNPRSQTVAKECLYELEPEYLTDVRAEWEINNDGNLSIDFIINDAVVGELILTADDLAEAFAEFEAASDPSALIDYLEGIYINVDQSNSLDDDQFNIFHTLIKSVQRELAEEKEE